MPSRVRVETTCTDCDRIRRENWRLVASIFCPGVWLWLALDKKVLNAGALCLLICQTSSYQQAHSATIRKRRYGTGMCLYLMLLLFTHGWGYFGYRYNRTLLLVQKKICAWSVAMQASPRHAGFLCIVCEWIANAHRRGIGNQEALKFLQPWTPCNGYKLDRWN